ncbi:MAG: prenyltransferase/squalene oxidase repeat-containing protein [Thermodesulfobacteriota bacterium]|nr:prenyltransferase/squalene oxidase repeat-containing protein [Thermodesulfobacteriota bacterium]
MIERIKYLIPLGAVLFVFFFISIGQAVEVKVSDTNSSLDYSLKYEVQHAIERGLGWLAKNQAQGGYWSQPDHPALTGLVLTAYMGEPTGRIRSNPPDFVHNGYTYLLNCVKPDGGIYVREMANYNSSISLMALLVAANPSFEPVIRKARNFEIGLQDDFDKKGATDNAFDGGVGYGGRYQHSDLSNTMFALESIYYTKYLAQDSGQSEQNTELNWQAAIRFLERCQNLPSHNDQEWASDDPQNKGGFVYFPGNSKAGEMELANGAKALRSYGSISYAGLLSYMYADLKKDDPRVIAVLEWLRKNYTLDENPGMGQQGLYYYYHTMAKALAAYGINELVLADGRKVDWRRDLALNLLNRQNGEGFWINENGRWWERDPVLVTAYSVIILEIIYRGL